jgi:uncharacterized protein YdaU (DUF1376 family)
MQRPSMPLFIGDYLADTRHLETVQHGAYLLLIAHYWANEGLPDNDRELARITGLPLRSWCQMRPKIQAFFHDGWHHKRIDAELAKYDNRIARLKSSGSIGGTKSSLARSKTKTGHGGTSSLATAQHATASPQHNMLQPGNSNHIHKDITSSTSSVAARAREGPEKTPTNSSVDDHQRPKSVPKNPAQNSEELDKILLAKGWRQ